MRYAIPGAVLLLTTLMGAGLGRAGAGSLKAQEAQCSAGTDQPCSEITTCNRRQWFWVQMGTGLFFPVHLCVDWSREYSYWTDFGGGSGGPSDDSPPGDLPGSGEGA